MSERTRAFIWGIKNSSTNKKGGKLGFHIPKVWHIFEAFHWNI